MRFSTTFKLLIAVIVLGAVVWRLERHMRPRVIARKAPFEDVAMEDVDYILCEKDDLRVECTKRGRDWYMNFPVRARADAAVIAKLLSMAEGLTSSELITREQRAGRDLTLADYGLDDPGVRLKIGGRYFLREMHVGEPAPVGESVYVRFADEQEVYAVPAIVTNIVPPSLELFRDAHILPGDPAKASRIEIQQPEGFVQVVRRGDGWWIQQPFAAQADGSRIDELLKGLFELRAESYVWDPPVGDSQDEPVQAGSLLDVYGFAEDVAQARITVWLNGDEIGREVIFGKALPDNKDLIYVRRKAFESIFAARRASAPLENINAVELRDKLIFPLKPSGVVEFGVTSGDARVLLHKEKDVGWMITEPVKWQADDDYVNQLVSLLARIEVSEFGPEQPTEKLEELGLVPPAFSVCLNTEPCRHFDSGGTARSGSRLRECCEDMVAFGAADTNGQRHIVLASGQMATLDKAALGQLDAAVLANPLQYRARTVLALPAASVRRIDLEKAGVKESVVLSSTGEWTCSSETNRQVSARVIADLLLFAANLRAVRFESLNPKNLSGYGLQPPAVALTLGLSGDEGIQKTLMLGFKAGTDGIYGLIQGQDLLLILQKDVAELLSRNLLVPPESAPQDGNQRADGNEAK